MQGIKLNGCDTESYSRLSTKCRKCNYKDFCKDKKKHMEAYNISTHETSINTPAFAAVGITTEEAGEAIQKAMEKLFANN